MGIPAKALIFKALAGPKPRYQQSYPQKSGIAVNTLSNQALSAFFSKTHPYLALSGSY